MPAGIERKTRSAFGQFSTLISLLEPDGLTLSRVDDESFTQELPSLLLGTRNPGKLGEIETILGGIPWRFRSLREFENVDVAAEDFETYSGNAIAKAQFYARETGLCALADDSGLEVEALEGAPGVFSARYAGAAASDADRRILLFVASLLRSAWRGRASQSSLRLRSGDREARWNCA